MSAKARALKDKLKSQKASLRAGTIATGSRSKLEVYQLDRIASRDKLHTLQQIIEDYQANKSLHTTIDDGTRELIVMGHDLRLYERKKLLDKAEARVERGQRVVDAEMEEAKKMH